MKNKKFNLKIKDTSGVSLIIAIIFTSALMLVTASLYEVQSKVWQATADRRNAMRAYDLAESAAETALYWAGTHGVGESTPFETSDPSISRIVQSLYEDAQQLGIQNCEEDKCVGFRVLGRSTSNVERIRIGGASGTEPLYYSIPSAFSEDGTDATVRGTGDAAESCGTDALDADDPCHWNKLKFGENIEIPLYYESDANSDGVIGADETHTIDVGGGNALRLRIRTPCDAPGFKEPVGGCAAPERIELYPRITFGGGDGPYRNPAQNKDPVLIQWLISDAEGTSTLLARDVVAGGLRPPPTDRAGNQAVIDNTDLSAGRINDASPRFGTIGVLDDFVVLEKEHLGKDLENKYPKISCFVNPLDLDPDCVRYLRNEPTPSVLPKPILRLNLVDQPRREDGRGDPNDRASAEFTDDQINDRTYDVPFLEYQLLLTSESFSDNKSELIGFANVAGFHKEFRFHKKRPTGLSTFAIESF